MTEPSLPPDRPFDEEEAERDEPTIQIQPAQPKDLVALILAVAVGTAINIVVLAVMWDAIHLGAEISENGTQVISAVLGGVIGILGSYLGYSTAARRQAEREQHEAQNPPTPSPPEPPPPAPPVTPP